MFDTMTSDAVSVIGLGKVGVTLVAALTAAGYRVTGVDVVESQVKALNDGSFRTNEPGVMERLAPAEAGSVPRHHGSRGSGASLLSELHHCADAEQHLGRFLKSLDH